MSFKLALLLSAVLAVPLTAAPMPQPVAPEARWVTVGALRVAALHDTDFLIPNDGGTFGVDAGVPAVTAVLAAAGAPTDTVRVGVNALLVELPGHFVLIDTGVGVAASQLMPSLTAAGVKPGDVTDVLITHSHGDHVGGLITSDGAQAFPNAKVRMSAAEWTFLQANTGAAKLVAAITPQVATFTPGTMVVPGITAMSIPGHTPGHVAYEIVSGKVRLLDIGDTAHSTIVSLAKPDWSMGFDSDKAVGKVSRRAELTRLAASHEMIFAPHFPYPGVGTIAAKGDGFTWVPAAASSFTN
ncbi:MBL fold metallo-hydrolase [Polymorphobacter sp. PAMC 29334]|uniref:MBL fold metallo-hydrolase n=1 Tax=Polymorphobacter sp. PAMC 29334 TaxID=2862331 RepID=UPI001C685F84|nr:MBL fold metallo-hydrolase [Polymorphobacter sp. PAMC 29334]QYE35860.1 MBL fold metallo-hydrolase [Polymorphobacter sp. PAMC 29334]